MRNLDHADLPQTFLYRAASTSGPTQGLADAGARAEPLRSPVLFGRIGGGSGDARESSDACSDDALEQKPCSPVACRDLDAIGGPPSAQFNVKLIGMGG